MPVGTNKETSSNADDHTPSGLGSGHHGACLWTRLAGAQQGGGGNAADTGGSLPFTGLELALVAIAGVGLLGVGYAVRRASNPRESTP